MKVIRLLGSIGCLLSVETSVVGVAQRVSTSKSIEILQNFRHHISCKVIIP